MLETVGNAVAVSPDIALMRAATGQPVVHRGVEDQTHHPPLGPAPMSLQLPARALARGWGCRFPTYTWETRTVPRKLLRYSDRKRGKAGYLQAASS